MVTPLTVTVLSVFLFKERVVPLQWLFVLGGFARLLVIVRPGGQDFGWAVLFPLGTMACNSAFQLLTSRLAGSTMPRPPIFRWTGAFLVSLALPMIWTTVDSPWLADDGGDGLAGRDRPFPAGKPTSMPSIDH